MARGRSYSSHSRSYSSGASRPRVSSRPSSHASHSAPRRSAGTASASSSHTSAASKKTSSASSSSRVRSATPSSSTASKPTTTPASAAKPATQSTMPATTKQPETTKQHAQSTQPTQSTPAAQPAQPAQSVPATGTTVNVQGPGFFGSLLQGFGWGAGSSLGHAAAGALLGGASSNSPSEEGREEPVAAETPVEQDSVPKQENFDDVCRVQLKDFQSCLESSNQQLSACQMYYESLKACQERANQMKEMFWIV